MPLVRYLVGAAALLAPLGGCTGLGGGSAKTGGEQPSSLFSLIAPPTPAQAAAWAVDPFDADKRYRGTLMLANAPWGGEPVYIRLYEQAVTDGVALVRAAGVRGLALHGRPEHVPVVMASLTDEDRLLRWEAARALQRLHNPAAVPGLLRLLEEENEPEAFVRAEAATALGQYADASVVEGLIAALTDRDLGVNLAAQDSLRTLTGQDFGFNVRGWLAWRKSTPDLFAGRSGFEFPVFSRGRRGLEWINPFAQIPNEIASAPVGMVDPLAPEAPENTVPAPPTDRNN
ncbi:MAG TPA: hypothetical protein DEB06_10825 [Phycisphaerales bacterium]|nr:hypothetical protein [Phycisphaerales bacterium]